VAADSGHVAKISSYRIAPPSKAKPFFSASPGRYFRNADLQCRDRRTKADQAIVDDCIQSGPSNMTIVIFSAHFVTARAGMTTGW
jgi:hypothetical protein